MTNTEQTPNDHRPADACQVQHTVRPASEARWYCLSKDGRATLCADEADALAEVERDTADWPLHAPYWAVQLVDASAVADDRELLTTALRALVWETGSDGIMAAQTDKVIKALRARLLRA